LGHLLEFITYMPLFDTGTSDISILGDGETIDFTTTDDTASMWRRRWNDEQQA